MKELDRVLELHRKIERLNDDIEELENLIRSPKSQPISDMPHSTSRTNAIELYIVKKERLIEKRKELCAEYNATWDGVVKKCNAVGLTTNEILLLFLRFYHGFPWRECTAIMAKSNSKWNENKTFRVYRKVVEKLQSE